MASDMLDEYFAIEWILLGLLGWVIGASVNFLADVLPDNRRISFPYCRYCKSRISILNYFFYPRKCGICTRNRLLRTWFVELIFITLTILLWLNSPLKIGFWLSLLLFFYFGLVAIIDLEHRLILHVTSIFGFLIGLLIGIKLHGLLSTALGGFVGFVGMLILYFIGILFSKFSSQIRNQPIEEEALGFGDVNLSGIMGLLLGWPGVVAGLLLAIIIGGMASLIYIVALILNKKYHPNIALPYGPFLIVSTIYLLYLRNIWA